jgi:AbiV family abortive infection protein
MSQPVAILGHVIQLKPARARETWRALAENATDLICDAHILLEAGSFGRARSLIVLAQEELGKALWLYEHFEVAWSTADEIPRDVPQLEKHGRNHLAKYMSALEFGDGLPEFWGDYSEWEDVGHTDGEWAERVERRRAEIDAAAREANTAKQRGFYVDLDDTSGEVRTPRAVDGGSIMEDLRTVAQVIEMLLISDHTRMKHLAVTPYDSTHFLQQRLLPLSHPVEWASAPDSFRNGD